MNVETVCLELEHGKQAVLDCRAVRGDYRKCAERIQRALNFGFTFEELGTNDQELTLFYRPYCLRNAKAAVVDGRALRGSYLHCMQRIKRGIGMGFSFSELGTSQEEVDTLFRAFTLHEAKKGIERASEGVGNLEYNLKVIEAALSLGFSHEELGVSPEQIDGFLQVHALAYAMLAVKHAKKGVGSYKNNIRLIERALHLGFSYKNLQTTKEETEGFFQVSVRALALEALRLMRNFGNPTMRLIHKVTQALNLGFTFEELGTSQEEFEGFKARLHN